MRLYVNLVDIGVGPRDFGGRWWWAMTLVDIGVGARDFGGRRIGGWPQLCATLEALYDYGGDGPRLWWTLEDSAALCNSGGGALQLGVTHWRLVATLGALCHYD